MENPGCTIGEEITSECAEIDTTAENRHCQAGMVMKKLGDNKADTPVDKREEPHSYSTTLASAPQQQNTQPQDQHGQLGPQPVQHGKPGHHYAQPGPQYGQPGPQYGQPGPQYGQPGPQYGQPGPQYGTQRVITAQPMQTTTIIANSTAPPDYLGWSIFTTVCCCLCLGLGAIMYSGSSKNFARAGDMENARKEGNKARTLNIIGLVIGLIIYVIVVALLATYHSYMYSYIYGY